MMENEIMDKEIKARLDKLQAKITKAEDILEVKKLASRYLQYFQGADANGIMADFAFEMPDVSLDGSMGSKFVGEKPIREFFDQRPTLARMPGALVEHETTTQVVVIAKDGKTARMTAFSPGYKCLAQAFSQVWSLGKYYFEYIKINGRWKIWHVRWFVIVEGEAALGWLFQNRSYWKECLFPELDGIHNLNITVEPQPSVFCDNYRSDGRIYFCPEPPDEYDTWTGSTEINNTRGY